MHDFKHIFEFLSTSFAETVWPTRCVGCDLPGTLLCPECAEKLPYIDPTISCPACAAPFGSLVCTECFDAGVDDGERSRARPFPFSAARAAISYEGVGKALVTAYKDGGELRLDKLLASLLCTAVHATAPHRPDVPALLRAPAEDWASWADALAAIPSRPTAVRKRGFDHLQRIARLAAKWLELDLITPLHHQQAVLDQRGLDSEQRARNLRNSLAMHDGVNVLGKRILLVDDVLTTGATTSAAAHALLTGGAAEVRVAVVARVW